ncbi:MAG: ATP-binding cassette domain-containing protein [Gemmatimonadetes bacterium]|nr:ATP-binding cassette domain-containing protein [Gemmatimonadota bacterium]MBP6668727.1 ATP-binding cassette domain-containing protein [Gemmatimonadales bacterium]MBK6780734.1 ATP-binding cassette domain-containing protein [Gemmatimonadota bacterium]MBK7351587.1 ATP-binding cassette domain-containing protein [Gemmatimonadota bacterium]MBK7716959.1 ATP-binding cassette domain-containing protein [Gemmatimonadota bacterium]
MAVAVISVQRVTKRYAGHTAVHALSLEVPAGGIFGLLGPNGAGKTTTIRMLLSIITPDEGQVVLFGGGGSGRELAPRIGYLPEERGLYPKMRVLDQLAFLGEAKGLSRWDARKRAKAWLERLGIGDWALRKVSDLSKGMQQKVQFAGALQHEPELVILDEPFSGLDPVNSQVMRDVVVEVARSGRSVLFSTHIMEHAEKMCERVAIIARGEKVVDGTLAEIKREAGKSHVALSFTRNAPVAQQVLGDRSLVATVDDAGASAEVGLVPGADPERLLKALIAADVGLSRFEVVEPSLQSIFIAKVGPEAAHPVAREGV